MSAKHTPGPWWVTNSGVRDVGGYICHTNSATHYPGQDDRYERETAERAANKNLIAAAPELLKELQARANNAEQSAFEEWLAITRPSGYVEQVQSQWEASSAHEDFYDEWKGSLAAIAKATGAAS